MTEHRTGLITPDSFSENGVQCTSMAVVDGEVEVAKVSFHTPARRVAFQLPQRNHAAKLASRDYIM